MTIIVEWIAFGIGCQLYSIPIGLLIGWLVYRRSNSKSEKQSHVPFLLPCILTLAVWVWLTGKSFVITSYLDFGSSERVAESLRQNEGAIDSNSLRLAVFPALGFAASAFSLLLLKRVSHQWIFAVSLFFGICLYLGFLDNYLTRQKNTRNGGKMGFLSLSWRTTRLPP